MLYMLKIILFFLVVLFLLGPHLDSLVEIHAALRRVSNRGGFPVRIDNQSVCRQLSVIHQVLY